MDGPEGADNYVRRFRYNGWKKKSKHQEKRVMKLRKYIRLGNIFNWLKFQKMTPWKFFLNTISMNKAMNLIIELLGRKAAFANKWCENFLGATEIEATLNNSFGMRMHVKKFLATC